MRTVQLHVPALFDHAPAAAGEAPAALSRWLARARRHVQPCAGYDALLCAAFGLRAEAAPDAGVPRNRPAVQAPSRPPDLPTGALALLGEGIDPGDGLWMHADPVHLHARRTDLVLIDAGQLDIAAGEAQAVVDTLNAHFEADGMHFIAPAPQRWYVRVAVGADLRTVALGEASGRSVDPLLPTGADALLFIRRANEAQMLLHEHPVNAARTQHGAAEINSLWFWGLGHLPPAADAAHTTWWTDDVLAVGLARQAGAAMRPGPAAAAQFLAAAGPGAHAIALPRPAAAGGAPPLAQLAEAWLAPLLRALGTGQLAEATLATHAGGQSLHYALSRLDLLKFWRRRARWPEVHAHA